MMRTRTAFLIALALVTTAACEAPEDTELEVTPGEVPETPVAVDAMDMTVVTSQFESVGDAQGAEGTAKLERLGATREQGLELEVRLTGVSADEHAWHIHQGSCDNGGGVLIPLGGDLEPGADGVVQRTVTLNAEDAALLTPGEMYSVNVHASGSGSPGAPIACATLEVPSQLWGGDVESDTVPTSY